MQQHNLTISLPYGPSFDMIFIEGGEFIMGEGSKDTHKVKVTSFYLGKYQVTQALYLAIMGNNPSYFKDENRPVENVSWNDAQEFLKKLNKATERQFRLPSEAEWEFSARGGIYSQGYDFSGSDKLKQVGWYRENSNDQTHDVGLLLANELGIYDMSGNVFEWCKDKVGVYRVCRGGSWISNTVDCLPTHRIRVFPGDLDNNPGFRLCFVPQSVS